MSYKRDHPSFCDVDLYPYLLDYFAIIIKGIDTLEITVVCFDWVLKLNV